MDGEVILINLGTGKYYTIGGVADRVWRLIQEKATFDEICLTLTNEYDVTMEVVQSDMTKLTEQLVAEKLVGISREAAEPISIESPSEKSEYINPTLKKFDDMAEMFALDPPLPVLPKNDKK